LLEDDEEEPKEEGKKKKEKKGAAPPSAQTPVPKDEVSPLVEQAEPSIKNVSFSELTVPQSAPIPARARKMSILEEKNVFAHPGEKLTAKNLSSNNNMNPSKMVKHLYYQE
jgi:translation initiation factor eIF-2B subunit delta